MDYIDASKSEESLAMDLFWLPNKGKISGGKIENGKKQQNHAGQ